MLMVLAILGSSKSLATKKFYGTYLLLISQYIL